MAAVKKKGAAMKATSAKSGKVPEGEFATEPPAGKGVCYDIDLGEATAHDDPRCPLAQMQSRGPWHSYGLHAQ